MKKEKLILPITILLACLILGSFFFAIQINKQKSIERQELLKIKEAEETKRIKQSCYNQATENAKYKGKEIRRLGDGRFNKDDYDAYYEICLEKEGL